MNYRKERLREIRDLIEVNYNKLESIFNTINSTLDRLQNNIDDLEAIKEEMKDTDNINEAIIGIDSLINEIHGLAIDDTLILNYLNAAIDNE